MAEQCCALLKSGKNRGGQCPNPSKVQVFGGWYCGRHYKAAQKELNTTNPSTSPSSSSVGYGKKKRCQAKLKSGKQCSKQCRDQYCHSHIKTVAIHTEKKVECNYEGCNSTALHTYQNGGYVCRDHQLTPLRIVKPPIVTSIFWQYNNQYYDSELSHFGYYEDRHVEERWQYRHGRGGVNLTVRNGRHFMNNQFGDLVELDYPNPRRQRIAVLPGIFGGVAVRYNELVDTYDCALLYNQEKIIINLNGRILIFSRSLELEESIAIDCNVKEMTSSSYSSKGFVLQDYNNRWIVIKTGNKKKGKETSITYHDARERFIGQWRRIGKNKFKNEVIDYTLSFPCGDDVTDISPNGSMWIHNNPKVGTRLVTYYSTKVGPGSRIYFGGCYVTRHYNTKEIYFPHLRISKKCPEGLKPIFVEKCMACRNTRNTLKEKCAAVIVRCHLDISKLPPLIRE